MFHRYTSFHQTISPDDAILKRDNLWDGQIMSHCVDTGFDDILYKCNRGLVLPVKGNSQPYHNYFFDTSDTSFFDIFYRVLEFIGTFLLDILFEFLYFYGTLFFDNLF